MAICVEHTVGQCKCEALDGVVTPSSAHKCLYCSRAMHAICGRQLNEEEQETVPDSYFEGSSGRRVCSSCQNSYQNVAAGPNVIHTAAQRAMINSEGSGAEALNEEVQQHQSSNSDEDLLTDEDVDYEEDTFSSDSSDDEESKNGNECPYESIQIFLAPDKVTVEIDDIDGFAADIAGCECINLLNEISKRLLLNVEDILPHPPSPKQLFDIFLPDIVLDSLAEASSSGLQVLSNYISGTGVQKKEIRAYIETLMMCAFYDTCPSTLLGDSGDSLNKRWYNSDEIKRRITCIRFHEIRKGLSTCLGLQNNECSRSNGVNSIIWKNPRIDLPSTTSFVEQAVSSTSSCVAFYPTKTILGIDDDQLKHASRYHRHRPFKGGDGKKGMGPQATSMTSVLTTISVALHTSLRGETIPEILSSLLQLSGRTTLARRAAQTLKDSIIAIDRGYATNDVLQYLFNGEIPARFICTLKKLNSHPVTYGTKEPKRWQFLLSDDGMGEFVVFKRTTRSGRVIYATGYKDLGKKKKSVLQQFTSFGQLSPFQFSLKPQNRVSWRKDVKQTTVIPTNLLAHSVQESTASVAIQENVTHERRHVHLLTYSQTSDQAWWLLRSLGISSTVSNLISKCCLRHFHFVSRNSDQPELKKSMRAVAEFCSIGTVRDRDILWGETLATDESRSNQREVAQNGITNRSAGLVSRNSRHVREGMAFVKEFIRGRSARTITQQESKESLQEACSKVHLRSEGTKATLVQRLLQFESERTAPGSTTRTSVAPTGLDAGRIERFQPDTEPTVTMPPAIDATHHPDGQNERIKILTDNDNRLYKRKSKASEEQESGSINERYILNAIQTIFDKADGIRDRRLFSKKQRMAAIIERGLTESRYTPRMMATVDAIAAIDTLDEENETSHNFEVAVVECKTFFKGRNRIEMERIAGQLGPSRYGVVIITDDDLTWSTENARTQRQRFGSGLVSLLDLIPDNQHRSQIFHHMGVYNTRRALYVVAGANSISYIVDVMDRSSKKVSNCVRTVMQSMLQAGVEQLFDPTAELPIEVQGASFFQTADSRMLHQSIGVELKKIALNDEYPLPEAKYIRPTCVRSWNEMGKTGTDTFSRQAKKKFPHRVSTRGGISKVVHRQISVCIVNAAYAWRAVNAMSKIYANNGDVKEILPAIREVGYTGLRRKMSNSITMRNFIRLVMEESGLPYIAEISSKPQLLLHHRLKISPSNAIEGPLSPSKQIPKPKRKDFIQAFNSDRGRNRRLSGTHEPSIPENLSGKGKNGPSCWLFTPSGSPETPDKVHRRSRTKALCLTCYSIPLCTVRRCVKSRTGEVQLSKMSCFEYFHTMHVISKLAFIAPSKLTSKDDASPAKTRNAKGFAKGQSADVITKEKGNTVASIRSKSSRSSKRRKVNK